MNLKKTAKKENSEIQELIDLRNKARKERNFKLADEIRDKLSSMGVIIEDTPNGTKFTFK